MVGWLRRKIDGMLFRSRSFRYGILYGKSKNFRIPDRLKLMQGYRKFIFDRTNETAFEYEFREICLLDNYHLNALGKKINVSKIVDIGANQGLFILAARKRFSKARIDAYEPNPNLQTALCHNATLLDVRVYPEAVAAKDGYVDLEFRSSDLETRTVMKETGKIKAVSLSEAIKRIGGPIDILKMDCEGAEWDILEEEKPFQSVRSITMEYHLWAKPQSSLKLLTDRLQELGFSIVSQRPLSETFGLVTAIKLN